MDSISILYIILIFIIGFYLAQRTAKKLHSNIPYFVFILHMLMSTYYYYYTFTHAADANMYYYKASNAYSISENFGNSTYFIIFLTTILVKLGFNKLAIFYLFGLFGFIGFLYFIKLLPNNYKKLMGFYIIYLILLLPGFHFWTSALGKDSIFFMLLMMFFYSLKDYKRHFLLLIFSLTILSFIRPHMGFILMISIIIAILLKNPAKLKSSQVFLALMAIVTIILTLPFLISFLNIDQMEMNAVNERLEAFSAYGAAQTDNMNSYVDVRSYSLPMKMFAYLFRPLFFDAHSIMQLLASFENLFLLILLFLWLFSINLNIIKWYHQINDFYKIMFVYVIIAWVILSMGMYNLGLASRQKYMLLPILFILFMVPYNKRKKN